MKRLIIIFAVACLILLSVNWLNNRIKNYIPSYSYDEVLQIFQAHEPEFDSLIDIFRNNQKIKDLGMSDKYHGHIIIGNEQLKSRARRIMFNLLEPAEKETVKAFFAVSEVSDIYFDDNAKIMINYPRKSDGGYVYLLYITDENTELFPFSREDFLISERFTTYAVDILELPGGWILYQSPPMGSG